MTPGVRGAAPAVPVLEIASLGRSFGRHRVITDLDVRVTGGERVALTGPNGSGKTTLIRCIAGTLTPSRGSIRVVGSPAGSIEARRRIGSSLGQERSFYLRLTGFKNLVFFASLRRGRRAAVNEVRDVVEELEIEDIARHRVDTCSAGMVQQLSFARALLGDPSLLVLDEPTRSLDRDATTRLWRAIDRRPDVAVVIATHVPDDVGHCHRSVTFPS